MSEEWPLQQQEEQQQKTLGLGAAAFAGLAGTALTAGAKVYSASQNKTQAPATVPYQNVDPTQVQNNSIQGDLGSLASASQLSGSVNTTTAQQALAARNITQPGYSNLAGALSSQATSLAQNPYQVPQSVVDQLSQYAAENNIGEGTGASSGFSQSNLLRSLGINALQYGQTNLSAATSALSTLSGTAPNVNPTSPLSFLLTPSQALQTQTTNNTNNQQIGQGAANAAATAANSNSDNLWDSITSQISPLSSAIQNAITPSGGGNSGGGNSGGGNTGPGSTNGMLAAGAPNSLALRSGTSCWVARAVFGERDPRWRRWRKWFFSSAPRWFLRIYMRYGRTWAAFINRHPALKPILAVWMNRCIATIKWKPDCVATPA